MKFTYAPGSKPLAGYTIKRGVGRGAFGEVYYAVSDGGKDVALKLILQHVEVELRGIRECLNLDHPNLVRLYDVITTPEGESWVVMEYCDGESLEEAIDAHPDGMPLDEALQWFRGICAGVGYLHERGVVHRDLKPSHIFRENGIVKICDYGLAKFITTSKRSGNTDGIGTVHYAAPEMAQGKYGAEIDLYSIGVMLFEALSGDVPFEGQTAAEILMKHLTQKPDVSQFPNPFRQIIARLLEKNPRRRFQSVEELMKAFNTPITSRVERCSFPAIPLLNWGADRVKSLSCGVKSLVKPARATVKIRTPRLHRVREFVRGHKLATVAIIGIPILALAIGISIGDANRAYWNRRQRVQRVPTLGHLATVPVKRNDRIRSMVELREIATFRPINPKSGWSLHYPLPAYEVIPNQITCRNFGIGNREILESLWNEGYSPIIEIEINHQKCDESKISLDEVYSGLRSFINSNNLRRRYCSLTRSRFGKSKSGFTLRFRRSSSREESNRFYLLAPEMVFDLSLNSVSSKSDPAVFLKDIADFRIIAGRS
ncbi:MAG: hypothetical protein Tsb009_32920 [Planctomycetaceae bacterium]